MMDTDVFATIRFTIRQWGYVVLAGMACLAGCGGTPPQAAQVVASEFANVYYVDQRLDLAANYAADPLRSALLERHAKMTAATDTSALPIRPVPTIDYVADSNPEPGRARVTFTVRPDPRAIDTISATVTLNELQGRWRVVQVDEEKQ